MLKLAPLLAGFLCVSTSLVAASSEKPHIVFFLIDDLGFADCGFNGGTEIKTPNIDRLAASGAVLENHYVQPLCSPTRSALLTGRYPTRTGVYTVVTPGAKWGLPLQERTLAQALKEAGYFTAINGKWHLGEFEKAYQPNARGFDHQYGHFFGALDYFTHQRDQQTDWYRNGEPLNEPGYTTHLVTAEASKIIENRPPSKPLFLYVPFNGVHSPHQVPESYLEPYPALTGSRQKLAGMLAAIDEAVGKIQNSLSKSGILENTLLVFSSDNGGPRPGDNTPLRDFKGSLFEGGIRAAAFATWPGRIPAGQRIREPLHVIDWYPTILKLAGVPLEQPLPVDGKDIWPVLTQSAPTPHDSILSVSPQGVTAAAVRIGNWKLIASQLPEKQPGKAARGSNRKKGGPRYEPVALYDLAADPGETTNLAASHPERVSQMQATLRDLLKDAAPHGQEQ
jgi:arylsulfatase A-like enzyme